MNMAYGMALTIDIDRYLAAWCKCDKEKGSSSVDPTIVSMGAVWSMGNFSGRVAAPNAHAHTQPRGAKESLIQDGYRWYPRLVRLSIPRAQP